MVPRADEKIRAVLLLNASRAEFKFRRVDGSWGSERVLGPQVWILGPGVADEVHRFADANITSFIVGQAYAQEILRREISGSTILNLMRVECRDFAIRTFAGRIQLLYANETDRCALYVESTATCLVTHLLQAIFGSERPPDRAAGLPLEARERLIAFIDENLANNYKLAALARVAGYGPNHFLRLFQKSFQMSGARPRDRTKAGAAATGN